MDSRVVRYDEVNMKIALETYLMRVLMLVCMSFSISLMYYTYFVNKDYVIFTNPNGIPTGVPSVSAQ